MQVFVLHALSFGVFIGAVLWRLPCLRVRMADDQLNVPPSDPEAEEEYVWQDELPSGHALLLQSESQSSVVVSSTMAKPPLAASASASRSGVDAGELAAAAEPNPVRDYNSWVMALDLFSVIFLMFMPLALVAPALVLFYLVGSSYTWVFAWCCFWVGAVGTLGGRCGRALPV